MGWATPYIQRLQTGEVVSFRPSGHSMRGKVDHRQLVTIAPLKEGALAVGDIVLCKVKGREYLHLIVAIQGEQYCIGNNRGHLNGWITKRSIFGRLIAVE